jgi:hypothetical protein
MAPLYALCGLPLIILHALVESPVMTIFILQSSVWYLAYVLHSTKSS